MVMDLVDDVKDAIFGDSSDDEKDKKGRSRVLVTDGKSGSGVGGLGVEPPLNDILFAEEKKEEEDKKDDDGGGMFGGITSAVENVTDQVEDKVEDTTEAVNDKVEEAVEAVDGAKDDAAEAVENTTEAASEAAENVSRQTGSRQCQCH